MLEPLLYLLIGLLIGGLISYLLFRPRSKGTENIYKEKLQALNDSLNEYKAGVEDKQKEIIGLSSKLSSSEADYRHLNQRFEEKKKEIEEIQEKFRIEFKNLANEILEEKTQKFTAQNSERLTEILDPLNKKIKEFEKKVEETYLEETKQRISLKEEVKRLTELNVEVSKETSNLTKALKGDSKTQGNWGEVILESILERSGLKKDREYVIQPSYPGEDGSRLQPDVVVTYPGNRSVIIDSKVSLTAYERFSSEDSERPREQARKEHITSIRNHIRELSEKNYQDIYQLQTVDFVMMFLPVEPAYQLAIQEDPDIWNTAYEKRILLMSPTNLIAALKMVESMWRQEYQSKNVMEIARQSGALYDKFEGLITDLKDLGKRLDSAQIHYQNSMNKLSEGRGSLVSKVEKIKKLGAKTKKSLPEDILDKADLED